jgi:hypothetical protein
MRLINITRISIIFVMFSLLLTSCSDTSEVSESDNSTIAQQPIGTNGALIEIFSDNVSAAGYEDKSMIMTVQFKTGAIYEYYAVPADLWLSFVAAQPHPWSQVGYPRLVKGGIAYKRIG